MALPVYQQAPDAEYLNGYHPGGYHPVLLGDTFNGRYTVIPKLGYGTYATVWLVKDAHTSDYVSLKILTAEASAASQEVSVLSQLQVDGPGREYTIQLLDQFQHNGPNGTHQCIVTELSGPSLTSDTEDLYHLEIFPVDVAKRLIAQISMGVKYIHSRHVVHGDLHLGNILIHSNELQAALKKGPLEAYFGEPQKCKFNLRISTGAPPPSSPHVPEYYVLRPDPTPLLHLCLDDPSRARVKIIDFSESYILNPNFPSDTQPRPLHAPLVYRPPEGLLPDAPASSSPATDIWSLAVLFNIIFTGGGELFGPGGGSLFRVPSKQADYLLCEMVLALGRFPEPLWSRWPNRHQYFDEKGNWIGEQKPSICSGHFPRIYWDEKDKHEWALFTKILRRMVDYDSECRATISDLVRSEWYETYCAPFLRQDSD
ncbi:hypothetical protein HGRIS_013839 [Hohenbuehelia grisea]|uniref:non-specific serine/threonine protein kinase n=1 Tax=Hohenbuehelia grisea TaxID=104357 RepID=A0ABR3IWQ4_9AGAR